MFVKSKNAHKSGEKMKNANEMNETEFLTLSMVNN